MFIVTGGGGGIGRALTKALVARGKSVLIVGRNEHALIALAKTSNRIDYLVADVGTSAGRSLIEARLAPTVTIEGLVHNAGIIDPIRPILNMDEQSWRDLMAVNVEAPLFLTQLLMPKLEHGRVLNISSGAAHFPVAGWSAYCVSKAAVSMLTRCWQVECSSPAFASVMPGIVDTNMVKTIRHAKHMDADKSDFFRELKEKGQMISPDTVGHFLCWLLLDVNVTDYRLKEWDIYDTTHHQFWLPAGQTVPAIE